MNLDYKECPYCKSIATPYDVTTALMNKDNSPILDIRFYCGECERLIWDTYPYESVEMAKSDKEFVMTFGFKDGNR